jgi:hypothetical protein
MRLVRLLVVAMGIAIAAPSAWGVGFCGLAHNFGNGADAKVRLRKYRVTASGVEAKLVCSKWRQICNRRAGRIQARIGTIPGTSGPLLQGTLTYGTRLTCGVYCQVDGTVDAPAMLFCQFNCPAGSNAVQVSFTVGPTVCQ